MKLKKIYFICYLFFCPLILISQNYNSATYVVKVDKKSYFKFLSSLNHPQYINDVHINDFKTISRSELSLSFNNNISKFDVIEQMGIDEKNNDARDAFLTFFNMELATYLDLKSRDFYTERGSDDFAHLRKTKAEPLEWKITNEQKKAGNLIYKKATAIIKHQNGDQHFEAWFCPSISNQFGPATYFGLPGLITEVYVNEKSYSYSIILKKLYTKPKHTVNIPFENRKVLSNKESEGLFRR